MKAYTITPKGQVTIPAEIREKLKLYPGDKITYEDTAAGILLKPAKKDMIDDFGFLKERKSSEELEEIRNSVRKKIADHGNSATYRPLSPSGNLQPGARHRQSCLV